MSEVVTPQRQELTSGSDIATDPHAISDTAHFPDGKAMTETSGGKVLYDTDESRHEHIVTESPVILINLCYEETETSINSDRMRVKAMSKDSVIFIPKSTEISETTTEQGEVVLFELTEASLESMVTERGASQQTFKDYRCDLTSALIGNLAQKLRNELLYEKASNSLAIEELIIQIQLHTIELYGNHRKSSETKLCKLPNYVVNRVNDYIEDNLNHSIHLEDLAKQACLSEFHFNRAFKTTTGLSPHQTVLCRRLHKARRLLCQTKSCIVDIALMTGFSSQSHLTTLFKKNYGVTPHYLRNELASHR